MCLEASARLAHKVHNLIEKAESEGIKRVAIKDLKDLRDKTVDEVCSPDGLVKQTLSKAKEEKLKENLN